MDIKTLSELNGSGWENVFCVQNGFSLKDYIEKELYYDKDTESLTDFYFDDGSMIGADGDRYRGFVFIFYTSDNKAVQLDFWNTYSDFHEGLNEIDPETSPGVFEDVVAGYFELNRRYFEPELEISKLEERMLDEINEGQNAEHYESLDAAHEKIFREVIRRLEETRIQNRRDS